MSSASSKFISQENSSRTTRKQMCFVSCELIDSISESVMNNPIKPRIRPSDTVHSPTTTAYPPDVPNSLRNLLRGTKIVVGGCTVSDGRRFGVYWVGA
eukprot:UN02386